MGSTESEVTNMSRDQGLLHVCIVSIGHSGSTILGMLLGGAPDGIALGEIEFSSRHLNDSSLICSCGKSVTACRVWREAFDASLMDKEPADRLRLLYQKLYDSVSVFPSVRIMVDTSKIDRGLQVLPLENSSVTPKVIFLVRDPRSYLVSLISRWYRSEKARKDGPLPIAVAKQMRRWLRGNQKIERSLRSGRFEMLTLAYEDLVLDSPRSLSRLSSFLGCELKTEYLSNPAGEFHIIHGNRLRFEPQRSSTLRYDARWMYHPVVLLLQPVLWPFVRYARRITEQFEVNRSDIMIVVPSLSLGGAERVAVFLAEQWQRIGHRVVIVTTRSKADDFYTVPSGVPRVALNEDKASPTPLHALRRNLKILFALRAQMRVHNPDRVVSFLSRTNVQAILAAAPLGIPVVVSERNDFSRAPGGVWRFLLAYTYRRAHRVVVQTQRNSELVQTQLRGVESVTVIPNSVAADFSVIRSGVPLPEWWPDGPVILGMGRLHPQKGFDLLIRAFAQIAGAEKEWSLVILGEGNERLRLEHEARELGMDQRVLLPGQVEDVIPYLLKCKIFVLSSRYEGFPNALIEAMSAKCACIASDCAHGPREILTDEVDGILVPVENQKVLSDALHRLIRDSALRERLGRAARMRVQHNSSETVLKAWSEALGK